MVRALRFGLAALLLGHVLACTDEGLSTPDSPVSGPAKENESESESPPSNDGTTIPVLAPQTRGVFGELDVRFHGRGYISLPLRGGGRELVGVARSGPHHIFTLGYGCVVERYDLETGERDPGLGDGVELSIGGDCRGLTNGADGRVYASTGEQRVVRLDTNGHRDPSLDIVLPREDTWSIDPAGRLVTVSPAGRTRRLVGGGTQDPTFPETIITSKDQWKDFYVVGLADGALVFTVGRDLSHEEPRTSVTQLVEARGVSAHWELPAFSGLNGSDGVSVAWSEILDSGDVLVSAVVDNVDSMQQRGIVVRLHRPAAGQTWTAQTVVESEAISFPAFTPEGALVASACTPLRGGPPRGRMLRVEADGRVLSSADSYATGWIAGRLFPLGGGVAATIARSAETSELVLAHVWIDP